MLDTTVQRRISILVYADLETAFDYLIRVFGLGPGQLTRDGKGRVVHGELQAGDGVVWLHPESPEFGLSSPGSLGAATAMVAVTSTWLFPVRSMTVSLSDDPSAWLPASRSKRRRAR